VELVDLRMLATNEITNVPSELARCLSGWGLNDLSLRASNEGLLRPRVARAQKIIRLHPSLSGLCATLFRAPLNEHFGKEDGPENLTPFGHDVAHYLAPFVHRIECVVQHNPANAGDHHKQGH
jgi:hypothetical protein